MLYNRPFPVPFILCCVALGLLLVTTLAIYLVSYLRNRGKPATVRKSAGMLGGASGFGVGSRHLSGGPANAVPPGFSLTVNDRDPNRPEKEPEDPLRR